MNEQPIPYESRLLRGHRRYLERAAHARILAELVAETGGNVEEERAKRRATYRPPADERDLRGLPAIGRGVRGAVAGSVPGSNLFR
jgi:hypothetical protein